MGQYYFGVIINKESKQPMMAHNGYKLIECGWATTIEFAYELSKAGRCYKQRVTWAGDCSDRKDYDGLRLYDYLNGNKEDGREPVKLPEAMDNLLPKYPSHDNESEEREKALDKYWKDYEAVVNKYLMVSEFQVRPELRYLCNHDRKEYYDLQKFCDYLWEQYKDDKRYDGFECPLAILTSDPTCRICGGGDYFYQEGFEYYGTWSDCVISTEQDVPEGYKEVRTLFEGRTRIWEPDTICHAITGEKRGHSLPSPSAYDFGLSICHYDEKHCHLACVSRETILQMYADWQQKVDVERVYKAFDAVMRAVKNDPMLEQVHKGMTVEHRQHKNQTTGYEWTDHVAIVNDVEVYLEKNEDGYKHDYKHKAMLGDIEYHCDTKSRRYFRKLAKERKAATL